MKTNKENKKEYMKNYNKKNKDKLKIERDKPENKEKIKEYNKVRYQNNKEKIKKRVREYNFNNKEKIRETKIKYRKKHKDRIQKKHKEYYQNNKEKIKNISREWVENNRIKVFNNYGNFCCWCGESNINCLTVDHINGNGRKHNKEIGGGNKIYRWLIKNNFPEEFQTLCYNCNCGLKRKGFTKEYIKSRIFI